MCRYIMASKAKDVQSGTEALCLPSTIITVTTQHHSRLYRKDDKRVYHLLEQAGAREHFLYIYPLTSVTFLNPCLYNCM